MLGEDFRELIFRQDESLVVWVQEPFGYWLPCSHGRKVENP